MSGTPSSAATVASLCRRCVHDLEASAGVVSLMTRAGYRAAAHATDARAGQLDEDQFTLGEGPGVDAFTSSQPVLAVDLDAPRWRRRWPLFVPIAQRASYRAALAFPLSAGASSVGVMTVYGSEPVRIDAMRLTRARIAADEVTMTLLAAVNSSSHPPGPSVGDGAARNASGASDDLPQAPLGGVSDDDTFYRAEIYQAAGMIMAQLNGTIDDAMVRLRGYAFAHDEPLHEVARRVVNRQLRFEPDV
jgi:hypothetical protein